MGGGFAGLFAARALRRAPVEITLVDRAQHHLFQPLLYQLATGMLSEGQIAIPLRRLLARQRNVRCELAEVVDVDPDAHHVVAARPGGTRVELGYDDLVVAVGVRQSYFGHDEFARWAPGMKTIGDALTIRRKVFGAFEMAETAEDPAERRRWLTFALVGAGPTGVELAGQIRELATRTLRREFRTIEPEEARVLLFDGGHMPLASFGPALSRNASSALEELGVEVAMGSVVTLVDADGLVVRDARGDRDPVRGGHRAVDRGRRGAPGRRRPRRRDRRAPGPGGPGPGRPRPDRARPPRHLGDRRRHERRRAPRGRGGRHAGGLLHRAAPPADHRGAAPLTAVPLPRPRLGGLHLARARGRLGRAGPPQRASSAGWRGCSCTSASSPATATGSAPS